VIVFVTISMNPESRRMPNSGDDLPMAVSPTGRVIRRDGFLPTLPPPKKIVVGRDALWVDGWVFSLKPISKQTIHWLVNQVSAWCESDPSEDSRAQIMGVLDAVEQVVGND
jgi:hypothetical protein